ncbi:anaerobic C4-dicarboxylate transporter [Salmonella enterica]|nr:anaerobic C4-dicarboxylate transporter [Salmonella enterica]
MLFSIQLLIILICLFYGARKGGIALGLLGGIGLVILVFVFHLQPGKPPVDVMLVIIAVVAASATLQASGGLDVMLQIAEKLLRRNPKYVSIVAPFVTCTLTILCGTGHVVYTILPIIYDVAIKNNIRPERPMAASSIGAQMGIIASPVSVAVVSLVAMLGNVTFDGKHLEFLDLLSITIPSTLLGILAIGIFSWFRGKDLDKDEAFQKFISVPENRQYVYGDTATLLDKKLPKSNWLAMWIFLAAIVPVALAIGVDPAYIVASAPACYGYYILPTYPSDLAAIQFDRSGTTRIGRFVINHSFILPGLIGVSVSCVFGWIFAAMYGFL